MKLCMIGSRGHYGIVFEGLSLLTDVKIAGISSGCEDDVTPLLKRCEAAGHTPAVYDDYLTMLDEVKPDMVCIDGPFDAHAQMCIDAFERNIHVFCEKPMALTLGDLDRAQAAYAKTKNLHFVSMVAMRYQDDFSTAWKAVRDGAVGTVKLIRFQKSYKLGERPPFYKSRKTYGGTIPWVGSHAIDFIYWFSQSGFKSVCSTHTATDNFGFGDLEIAAQCQFVMSNGIQASASIDYLRPASAPTHGDDRIRVAGTKGILELINGTITLLDEAGSRTLPLEPSLPAFNDFVLRIKGDVPGRVDAAQTFEMTRACLLARESADSGVIVRF